MKSKQTIIIDIPKPRNKALNDVLRTKKGGRHYSPKRDYNRAKEKARGYDE